MDAFDEMTELVRSLVQRWLISNATDVAEILKPEERPLLRKLARIRITEAGMSFPDPGCEPLWRELQYGSQRMPSYQLDRMVTQQIDAYLTDRYQNEVQ